MWQQMELLQGGERAPPLGSPKQSAEARWPVLVIEHGGSDRAVVAQALDAEQASIGGRADLLRIVDVAQPATDIKAAGVVDHRFGVQGAGSAACAPSPAPRRRTASS